MEGLPVVDQHMHSLGKAHERAYLEYLHDRLATTFDLPIAIAVLDPAEQAIHDYSVPTMLAQYAAATNTDLIVLTTHGRGGIARLWLGSVADELVHQSTVPLLLIRPQQNLKAVVDLASIKQILVALDGSEIAEQILVHAQIIGELAHAAYTLLHVVEPHTRLFSTPIDVEMHSSQQQSLAQHYMDHKAWPFRAAGAQVQIDIRMAEQVAAAILAAACDHHADLIAIATHGNRGLDRLLLGSVADKVVRGTMLPVLLYRPQIEPRSC
jgi:nucleotide-binding universal stress UspA family protein